MQIDAQEVASRLITATQAATLVHVSVSRICQWANPAMGYLAPDGTDEQGRTAYIRKVLEVADRNQQGRALYRYLDVVRAEKATRPRAHQRFREAA